jgi:hypothetical protein
MKLLGFQMLSGNDAVAKNMLIIILSDKATASIRQEARSVLKDLYLSGTLSDEIMGEVEEHCPYML